MADDPTPAGPRCRLLCRACGWRAGRPRRLGECPECRGPLTLTGWPEVPAEEWFAKEDPDA
jgi:hypothetical protein